MPAEAAGYSHKVLLMGHTADLEGVGRDPDAVADKLELVVPGQDIAGTEVLLGQGLGIS